MVNVWRSIRITIIMAVLLGILYPLLITGIGALFFPFQAQGSMVYWQGRIVGSRLIAQRVTDPGLFQPRPSAVHYAGNGSGGSNLGPTNPALVAEVRSNLQRVLQANKTVKVASIPPSMVESSASGLDPDISVADALLQIPRIAKSTGISVQQLQALVKQYETGRLLGIWGQPMVNTMDINLALLAMRH